MTDLSPVERLRTYEDELQLKEVDSFTVLLPTGSLTVARDPGWMNSRGLSVCYYYQRAPDLPKVQVPEHVAAGLVGEKLTFQEEEI